MDAINQPLLSVRDLSVAFHQQSGTSVAVDRISFEIKRGECVALVGESGSGKSVSALSILKLLPYPTASHPSGSIRFKGRELLSLSENDIRGIRGNDISIIFQEPMTSLNPLHTIESQIGEILHLHNSVSGSMVRARTLELLTAGRHPRTRDAACKLSASTLRRPAAAGDDRDGARQRAGPVDRGRADHGARCHRAGADSGAACGNSRAARHEPSVHHPRSRHRSPHRRCGLRHEWRQDRRAGAGRAGLHRAETSLHQGVARGRTEARPGAAAARTRRS